MLSQRTIFALLAVYCGIVNAQGFPDQGILPTCGQTCLTSMTTQEATNVCPGGAASCLCSDTAFMSGMHDCSQQACTVAADFPSVTNYLSSVCATAATSSTAATSAATSVLPSTTAQAATTAPPVSSSTAPSSTSIPNTVAATTPVATPVAATPSNSTLITSTTSSSLDAAGVAIATTSSSSSHTAATSTSASKTAATTATSASESASSTAEAGASSLSTGAKAGIGIGSAVGAVAVIAAIALCLIARKHKNRANIHSLQISDPMPGSGRIYASPKRGPYQNLSELEMKSRRYEDMVPRHSPSNMV